jgi:hypothetical protein
MKYNSQLPLSLLSFYYLQVKDAIRSHRVAGAECNLLSNAGIFLKTAKSLSNSYGVAVIEKVQPGHYQVSAWQIIIAWQVTVRDKLLRDLLTLRKNYCVIGSGYVTSYYCVTVYVLGDKCCVTFRSVRCPRIIGQYCVTSPVLCDIFIALLSGPCFKNWLLHSKWISDYCTRFGRFENDPFRLGYLAQTFPARQRRYVQDRNDLGEGTKRFGLVYLNTMAYGWQMQARKGMDCCFVICCLRLSVIYLALIDSSITRHASWSLYIRSRC